MPRFYECQECKYVEVTYGSNYPTKCPECGSEMKENIPNKWTQDIIDDPYDVEY